MLLLLLGQAFDGTAQPGSALAIYGVFDILDIRGEVVIGEGIKDNAPGIFVGEKLGTWKDQSPRFNIALDPIDGTTNLSKGMPNSISVIAAATVSTSQRASLFVGCAFRRAKKASGCHPIHVSRSRICMTGLLSAPMPTTG